MENNTVYILIALSVIVIAVGVVLYRRRRKSSITTEKLASFIDALNDRTRPLDPSDSGWVLCKMWEFLPNRLTKPFQLGDTVPFDGSFLRFDDIQSSAKTGTGEVIRKAKGSESVIDWVKNDIGSITVTWNHKNIGYSFDLFPVSLYKKIITQYRSIFPYAVKDICSM